MAKRNFIPLVPSGTINADASVAQLEQDVLAMDAKVGELAEDIGDTEQEINQLKSAITNKYTGYEQGAIAASTGQPTPNGSISRTGLISIDEFVLFNSPVGWQTRVAYFSDANGETLIKVDNYAYSAGSKDDKSLVLSAYPSTKSLRLHYQKYVDKTAQTTTPEMLAELAPVEISPIGLIYPMNDVVNSIKSQYFSLENETLTDSLTFTIPFGDQKQKNMLVESWAMWEGDTAPTISVEHRWYNAAGTSLNAYYGTAFEIGGKGNYEYKTFRVAPWFAGVAGTFTVKITIPAGTTLYIKSLSNTYSDSVSRASLGFNLNAHGFSGFGGPAQTNIQFEMAAKLGYKYCITIPKVTSDGVYVCLHDDNSIQATARNDDGSTIAEEYQNRPVSDFTYAELQQFDFGIVRGQPFAGERIPLLEDFFKICARTGMHPMLSVHPSLSGHWENIKAMAKKYGVLEWLNIKSDPTNIEVPMAVLLDEIESYTIDDSTGASRVTRFNSLTETYGLTTTKKVIEYNYNIITDALIEDAINGGYLVGCFNYGSSVSVVKELIEKGVTEFTEDFNASVGLNW